MSKERLTLLSDALRSGDYSQTRQRLRDSNGFCCLGVACDIYMKETGTGEWRMQPNGVQEFYIKDGDYSITLLPPSVSKWFGIDRVGVYDEHEHLALMNDKGHDFADIAGMIDKHADDLIKNAKLFL